MEVNKQARKTQLERDPTAKEEVREQKQTKDQTQLDRDHKEREEVR